MVLPVTNTAEEDGTFVNRDSRVQRYLQAKAGPGMARPAWWVLGELRAELERGKPPTAASDAFALMVQSEQQFAGLSYDRLGYNGVVLERAVAGAAS